MNLRRMQSFSAALVALVPLALGAACNKPAKTGDEAASAASAESCASYSEKLCELAGGETSPQCAGIKSTVDLLPPAACAAGLADTDYSKGKMAEARKACDELATKLCGELGDETKTCDMVKKQTATFPPERCQGMMSNYDQVLAQLQRMEAANKPLSEDKQAEIAADDAPAFGPKDAKVTIVEFSDFQCPYCTRAATAVKEIKKAYSDKVRFVFRQFPLSFHQNAHAAAQAALAAGAQGKFWEYHDKLFENQKALADADLEKYARELGLKMAPFKKAMKDGTYKEQVDSDIALGSAVAVSGTPTMFLNGKRVANATSFDAIKDEIEKALAN